VHDSKTEATSRSLLLASPNGSLPAINFVTRGIGTFG
jgi:hypothetical protein